MNQPLRREISMDHTGYLGNARVIHNNHYDAATQADIHHVALGYESEDEAMSRLHSRTRRATYSKQDIREQYCISDRGLGALESDRLSLFGCLSSHQNSPCSTRGSLLTVCVRQKVPSDENLHDLFRRHPAEYAPYPRRSRYPWGPTPPELYAYDRDLKGSYFRRKIQGDPSKYMWMPSDDESVRMERPRSVLEPCLAHSALPPPPPPAIRPKHVSFARSHTLESFDDAVVTLSSSSQSSRMSRSQERLLDIRKSAEPITKQPEKSENLLILEKLKRGPMKTQATQTEACLGRKFVASGKLNLSPRTIHRVKMVSQGAQTNGLQPNGRKLMKSFSEVGATSFKPETLEPEILVEHEPLLRTQSDEPPRSPFVIQVPQPEFPVLPSDSSSITEESECKKEIIIDFKPLVPAGQGGAKKPLVKTVSDGEMLLESRNRFEEKIPDKGLTSLSHDNITGEEEIRNFVPYFKNTPIRNEGIFKPFQDNVFSSLEESFDVAHFIPQDSIDEEFHENIIYSRMYVSPTENVDFRPTNEDIEEQSGENVSLDDDSVVPCCLLPDRRLSPFTSNDSLANDIRDHSDGIWNESQATVLQVDSGTENGTVLSGSELATSPGSTTATALTPSSRRKHLLMLQHQQRSSIDTDALDEEDFEQLSAKNTIEVVTERKQKFLSPNRRTPEPLAESPLPAVVPDILLSRTDSGRTNTDISESTTTDDYITANSGTDSSRKSNSIKSYQPPTQHEGSSFESASSFYSTTKLDSLGEDMVVPTFSIPEEANTPIPEGASPTDTSSSSGSYSVDGSCPELPQKPPAVPSTVPSEDDRSAHRSSSVCHYESPIEEDNKWKSNRSSEDENATKKRPFTLDVNTYRDSLEVAQEQQTVNPNRLSPIRSAEKPQKRGKSRTRSPMQGYRQRGSPLAKSPDQLDVKAAGTSDESSPEQPLSGQVSPRKSKKHQRKKASPTRPSSRRRNSDEKPSSLPGSLPRRKSTPKIEPYSPCGSPRKIRQASPDTTKLKALSAESLRSVSPGSDSVFYSDPSSSHATASEHQVHCLHCGKEVEIITTDDVDLSEGPQPDIVQPPAGFADSPRPKSGRLYKKFDRRFRSEERSHAERRNYRCKSDVRAKSEERGDEKRDNKWRKSRTWSFGADLEGLRVVGSSPSVLPGAPEDEDDLGMYKVPYTSARWIYIDDQEELQTWLKAETDETPRRGSTSSIESTESEEEFRKRYEFATHRMVHRKSCLEMYKRQKSRSFESDKTVIVKRVSDEFGFRIHGSKPVVISAIEPDTPAETSGIEIGDILLSVNGINVLDKNHSDVVKIAHSGCATLKLELARTCDVLSPPSEDVYGGIAICSGYLWKLGGHASGASSSKWLRRWFALKKDNCLYYFKTDSDKQPVGAMMLNNYTLTCPSPDPIRPFRFNLEKRHVPYLQLAADTEDAAYRWMSVLKHAIDESRASDALLEQTRRNLTLPPGSIKKPDCFGYLVKLGTQWRAWSRRYCVLKDACLYFYQDVNAKSAFGVACLHGYKVQQMAGSRKYAFELIPSDTNQKYYNFYTESDMDTKRWMAALEYSIDRWLKVG